MANNLGPSPTNTIHEKLADERRWQFGQTHQGKIDKLVSRQIFYIELTTNIHKIIDNPEMVNSIFEMVLNSKENQMLWRWICAKWKLIKTKYTLEVETNF